MQATTKIKESCFNTSIVYPLEYREAMKEARKEAESIFKDKDAIIILMKLLTGKNAEIKLTLRNGYARQLKKDIEQLFKIK